MNFDLQRVSDALYLVELNLMNNELDEKNNSYGTIKVADLIKTVLEKRTLFLFSTFFSIVLIFALFILTPKQNIYTSTMQVGSFGFDKNKREVLVNSIRNTIQNINDVYIPSTMVNLESEALKAQLANTTAVALKNQSSIKLKTFLSRESSIAINIQSQITDQVILVHSNIIKSYVDKIQLEIDEQKILLQKLKEEVHITKLTNLEHLLEISMNNIRKVEQEIALEKLNFSDLYNTNINNNNKLAELKETLFKLKKIEDNFVQNTSEKDILFSNAMLNIEIQSIKNKISEILREIQYITPKLIKESHNYTARLRMNFKEVQNKISIIASKINKEQKLPLIDEKEVKLKIDKLSLTIQGIRPTQLVIASHKSINKNRLHYKLIIFLSLFFGFVMGLIIVFIYDYYKKTDWL